VISRKSVIVTGAATGIGRSIATKLAANGFKIIGTFNKSESKSAEVRNEILKAGGICEMYRVELSNSLEIENFYKDAISKLDEDLFLVNNAAYEQKKDFVEITSDDLDYLYQVNFKAPFRLTQLMIPKMLELGSGNVLNISSIGGQWGGVDQIHYASLKSALIGLTKSIAKTYGRFGIRSNCIAPGIIQTPMLDRLLDGNELNSSNIPMGRVGNATEVAEAALFLLTDKSSYITGQTLNVNGGMFFS
jgi:acetoacetyl-CoA reductase/3-oxoacyl-[acyl-carrier protein] reductase